MALSLVHEAEIGRNGRPAFIPAASRHGTGTASPFWSQPFLALGLAGLWLMLAAAFNAAPGVDRFASELFFTPAACPPGTAAAACGDFHARLDAVLPAMRRLFHYLPAAVAMMLIALLVKEHRRNRGLLPQARYAWCALAAFVLGPGLLVNGLLKEFWGRPRPIATDLFGGAYPFVPAGEWSDACASNCSFVSGEASTIAWLVCLAPLLPQGMRRTFVVVAGTVAVLAALLRVAFGGHYLSDVMLGALSTMTIFAALLRYVEWRIAEKHASTERQPA